MRIALLIAVAFFAGLFGGFAVSRSASRGPVRPAAELAHPAGAPFRAAETAPERGRTQQAAEGRVRTEAEPGAPAPAGSGTVTGSVRTDDGEPASGVLLTAEPRLSGARGGNGPLAAQAVSDASGKFELQGLADVLYVVSAKLEGHEVIAITGQEAKIVRSGGEVDFVLRPVVVLDARVLKPDGTEAASASVKATRARHWPRPTRSFDWSPEDPTLRLPPGEYTLVATSGTKEELASEPVAIALRRGPDRASVTLQLVERSGICGRVILPREEQMQVTVAVLRTDSTAPLDPADVAGQGTSQTTDAEKGFRFAFRDLLPGRYVVAATRSEGRIEASVAVDVESGVTTQDIQLGAMDANDFIEVWVLGPGGEPLADVLFMDECQRVAERTKGTRSAERGRSVPAARKADGAYMVALFGSDACGYKDRVSRRLLTVETARFGKQRVQYELPVKEPIVLRCDDRATLDVHVTGYVGSEHQGFVAVGTQSGGLPKKPDAGGVVRLGPLDPGEHRLYFRFDQGSGGYRGDVDADADPVRLRPGPNKLELPLPRLQKLTLIVDPSLRASSLSLALLDADGAPTGLPGARSLVREDGNVTFARVPAGRYEVEDPNRIKGGGMIVTIPGVETLRFEPRPKSSLLVRIVDPDGRLARSGLRSGDRILGIDGVEFEDEDMIELHWKAAKLRQSVKLLVLRGVETLQLDYEPPTDGKASGDRVRDEVYALPR